MSTPVYDAAATTRGRTSARAGFGIQYLQRTFWDADRKLYVKAANDRTPDYVWREAAACAALVGSARHKPKTYAPVLRTFFHSLDQYWDAKAPIPAYEPAPTRGNGHDKYYDDNACTARILWLMADMETDRGKAFWHEAERAK